LDKLRHAFAVDPPESARCETLPPALENLAGAIVDWGLELPALMLIDSLRPLSFLAGEILHCLGPLANLSGSLPEYREVALALEDRDCLPMLARRIEEIQATRESQR